MDATTQLLVFQLDSGPSERKSIMSSTGKTDGAVRLYFVAGLHQ